MSSDEGERREYKIVPVAGIGSISCTDFDSNTTHCLTVTKHRTPVAAKLRLVSRFTV